MARRLRLVLFLALLCPWSAAAERPEWVSGTSSAYPKSAYLTGVGQGPSQEKAADKARAEIAKGLSLTVTAKTQATAQETSYGADSSFTQTVADDVRTSTAKVLDGVDVVSYWQDPQGTHYALAVLNREHSQKILRDKIEEYDRSFAELSAGLPKAEGKFARLRLALRLLQGVKSRRRLNADYRILNPEGKGIPAPASVTEVLGQARRAVSALTLQVEVAGEKAEQLTSRLIDDLSVYGLKAVERTPNPADILVEARASSELLPPENLIWYWAKAAMLVKMSYGATGEVFTRFEKSGQEAARDPGSAVDAALLSLADKAADQVFRVITTSDVLED